MINYQKAIDDLAPVWDLPRTVIDVVKDTYLANGIAVDAEWLATADNATEFAAAVNRQAGLISVH